MFVTELTPIFKELAQQPIAFASGFFSAILKLNLTEDPLKTWLEKQGINPETIVKDNNKNGPQSISIE